MSLLTSSTLPSCRSRHHRSMAPLLIDATSLGPSVLPLPDHSLVSISVPPPPPVRILSHRGYPMSKTPAPAARSKHRVSEHRIEVEYFLGVDQLNRNIVRASDQGRVFPWCGSTPSKHRASIVSRCGEAPPINPRKHDAGTMQARGNQHHLLRCDLPLALKLHCFASSSRAC